MTKDAKTEAALKAEQEASFQYQDDLFLFGITSRITQHSWDRWFTLHTQVREDNKRQSAVSSPRVSRGRRDRSTVTQTAKQTQPRATVPHKTKKSRQNKKQIIRKKK